MEERKRELYLDLKFAEKPEDVLKAHAHFNWFEEFNEWLFNVANSRT